MLLQNVDETVMKDESYKLYMKPEDCMYNTIASRSAKTILSSRKNNSYNCSSFIERMFPQRINCGFLFSQNVLSFPNACRSVNDINIVKILEYMDSRNFKKLVLALSGTNSPIGSYSINKSSFEKKVTKSRKKQRTLRTDA